ncbi:unnamed protein product [Alternaria alternata]
MQRRLAQEIQKIEGENVTDEQLSRMRGTLHEYTNALRDFEFIHANRWSTQFVKDIAASRIDNGSGSKLQGALISDLNLTVPSTHRSLFRDADLLGSFDPKLMEHSNALGQSLGTTRAHNFASELQKEQFGLAWKRFAFAFVGGLIIVVPMIILLAGVVKTKTLAVIPTSILMFAVGVALFAKTDPVNLLVATAAAKHTEGLELIGKKSCLCVDLPANEEETQMILERVWIAKFRVTKQLNVLATVQGEGPNHVADFSWKT